MHHLVWRELSRVHGPCRHNKNLNTDAWRKIQLWRHIANPQHPINRFATGNLQTLLHTPKVGAPLCYTGPSSRLPRPITSPLLISCQLQRQSPRTEHARLSSDWEHSDLIIQSQQPLRKGAEMAWRNADNPTQSHVISHARQAEGRQPHEEVRRFYAGHYSSNIMKGAVMGRHSLDELEAMVRAKFGDVDNADLRVPEFTGEALPCSSSLFMMSQTPVVRAAG